MKRTRLLRPATLAPGLAVLVAVGIVITAFVVGGSRPVLSRDQCWRQDIAYLARQLSPVHVDGLTGVSRSAWNTAAARLATEVPRLTDGQVIAGMARMVAMLRDDETLVVLPRGAE